MTTLTDSIAEWIKCWVCDPYIPSWNPAQAFVVTVPT